MSMHTTIVICCIVSLFLSSPSQMNNLVFASNFIHELFGSWEGFETYENPSKGIKLRYPSNWTISDLEDPNDPSLVVQFYSPNKDADVIVYAGNLGDVRIGLQELLDYTIASYTNSSEDFDLVNSSVDSELSGYPAYELEYSDRSVLDNSSLRVMERGTKIGNSVYTIIYEAHSDKFSSHLTAVNRILDSFETSTLSSLIR